MAEENKNENIVSEAPEGVVEAQHDAPTKGSVKAEPMQKAGDFEDLGPAVTSPSDKAGQDKTKDKIKKTKPKKKIRTLWVRRKKKA